MSIWVHRDRIHQMANARCEMNRAALQHDFESKMKMMEKPDSKTSDHTGFYSLHSGCHYSPSAKVKTSLINISPNSNVSSTEYNEKSSNDEKPQAVTAQIGFDFSDDEIIDPLLLQDNETNEKENRNEMVFIDEEEEKDQRKVEFIIIEDPKPKYTIREHCFSSDEEISLPES